MKIAPLYHNLDCKDWCETSLIHTGQHYDKSMSQSFIDELKLPEPDYFLNVGSGTHAEQTGKIMIAYEDYCRETNPDLVVVVGDVNSTLACALAARKLSLNIAHLEAGLRSNDMSMPEEINRLLTDQLSDRLWTPSADADANLIAEGIPDSKIKRVGNIMIDSYLLMQDKIKSNNTMEIHKLNINEYAVITLHRPANVDHYDQLKLILEQLESLSKIIKLIFPVHPRTIASLKKNNMLEYLNSIDNLIIIDPLPYISFMNLVTGAKVVITDSGGIQEETTFLNIPCITVRDNTERPITVTLGTNKLTKCSDIYTNVMQIINGKWKSGKIPEYWDGLTSKRVVSDIYTYLF